MSSRKVPQKKKSSKTVSTDDYPLRNGAIGLIVTFGVLVFVLPFVASVELWGITFASYSIGTDYFILIAFFALSLFLASRRRSIIPIDNSPGNGKKHAVIVSIILVALVIVSLNVRVAFAFLGDGAIYLGEVYRLVTQPGYETSLIKPSSFLGGYAVPFTVDLLNIEDSTRPFEIIGSIALVLTVLFVGVGLRKDSPSIRLLFTALLLGSGGLLMFFGYVELYSLGFAFAIGYFATSWQALKHNSPVWVPGIFLLLASLSAASSFIFIPSYLVLLHWKFKGTSGKPSLIASTIILAILPAFGVLLVYLFYGVSSNNPYLIPLVATQQIEEGIQYGWQYYTLFNSIHLLDIVNVLFLNGGIALALLALVLFARKKLQWKTPAVFFSIVALCGGLILILVGNATFGLARDWDIMTIPALGIIFFAFVTTGQLWEKKQIPLPLILPSLLVLAFTHSYIWVKVNAEHEPSAQRFEDIVDYYTPVVTPAYTFNALENLRKYHSSVDNREQYINILQRMGELRYNKLDAYRELIGVLKKPDSQPYQRDNFERMYMSLVSFANEPVNESLYNHIDENELREFTIQALISGIEVNVPNLVENYEQQFKQTYERWDEYPFYLAFKNPNLTPEEQYEIASRADFETIDDIALIIRTGSLFRSVGKFQDAAFMYEKALSINPNEYQKVYILLAQVYYRGLKDKEKTVKTLQRCIQNCIGTEAAAQAEQILVAIQSEQP